MRILLTLLLSFFLLTRNIMAGNGSSGVGNARIVPGVIARNIPNNISITTDRIFIKESDETLIKISPYRQKEEVDKLNDAYLGQLKAKEFIPEVGSNKKGYWVICSDGEKCYKLSPESAENISVLKIIGSLKSAN